jgi:hypothetical protein
LNISKFHYDLPYPPKSCPPSVRGGVCSLFTAMVSGSAIGTLVVFIISIIFVIRSFAVPIFLPYVGRKTVPINLTTAPIIAILILWAAQCLGPTEVCHLRFFGPIIIY